MWLWNMELKRRFIPTVVGNTKQEQVKYFFISVHPHGRGEHIKTAFGGIVDPGSSPRSWGTPDNYADMPPSMRFIPTVVGNTGFILYGFRRKPVHPHGRGEHRPPPMTADNASGSSPRSWGTLPMK